MSVNSLNNKSIGGVGSGGQNASVGASAIGEDQGFKQSLEQQLSGIEKKQVVVDQALKAKADGVTPITLKFSNHAVERMSQRGITFSPDQISKIENAASKAQAKGSKETLIFANDSALIVNLKDKTIVTVMDKNALRENVFTNIDSTIMI